MCRIWKGAPLGSCLRISLVFNYKAIEATKLDCARLSSTASVDEIIFWNSNDAPGTSAMWISTSLPWSLAPHLWHSRTTAPLWLSFRSCWYPVELPHCVFWLLSEIYASALLAFSFFTVRLWDFASWLVRCILIALTVFCNRFAHFFAPTLAIRAVGC